LKLRLNSWGELRTRSWQEISKRSDFARYRLGFSPEGDASCSRTCERPRFFFGEHDLPDLVTLISERLPEQASEIMARARRICRHQFDLLGYEQLDYGPEIDWHLDIVNGKRAPRKPWYRIRYLDFERVGDAKVIWELNRHQHLTTLAKAYLLSKDPRFAEEIFREWYDWWQQNPYPIGINWASSLEIAFRALSWLWIEHLLGSSPVIPPQFSRDLLRALAICGRHIERYLSTYFSPNTHLLGEGAALFFIGILCPQLAAAKRWRQLGWEIVLRESERQVQADGMHFEQSTYYHVYALDFFLHSRSLAAANQIPIPLAFERTIEKMLEVLFRLSQAGTPPSFGDDDGGRVFDSRRNRSQHLMDPLTLGAVLFKRADFKAGRGITEEFIWLMGRNGVTEYDELPSASPEFSSAGFQSSGIYVMAGRKATPNQVVVDSGRLGVGRGGHGHADALSLCMAINGREWLVDPGTFVYGGDRNDRDCFRGTGAHNTLKVDGVDQAEPSELFAWRRQPDIRIENWIAGETFDLLVASHTGYQRLRDPVTHRRAVFHLKSHFSFVLDIVLGAGVHRLEIPWHLAPGCLPPTVEPHGVWFTAEHPSSLALLPVAGHDWTQEIRNGWHSPAYGRRELSPVLHFEKRTQLPAEFATLLQPGSGPFTELGHLEAVGSAAAHKAVSGYVYRTREETHYIFYADSPTRWELASWASDAPFLYCGVSPRGSLSRMVVCGGSFVEMDHQRIFSARHAVKWLEWLQGRAEKPSFCSDEDAVTLVPNSGGMDQEIVTSGDRSQDIKRGVI
jgi:hypothetical protein